MGWLACSPLELLDAVCRLEQSRPLPAYHLLGVLRVHDEVRVRVVAGEHSEQGRAGGFHAGQGTCRVKRLDTQ